MLKKYFIQLIIITLILSSCATTPSNRVWRPWTQTMKSQDSIKLGSNLRIKIKSIANPLLGSEDLLYVKVLDILKNLSERRGFFVKNEQYDYDVVMIYQTEPYEKDKSRSFSVTNAGGVATSGLGVSIARAISTSFNVEISYSYTHTVSLEIFNKNEKIIWKGDATWDSFIPDIQYEIMPALQLILSDLPFDTNIIPKVPEVKISHAKNYYNLVCKDKWFSCPALPYKISFSEIKESPYPTFTSVPITQLSPEIRNANALSAYVDLIQTAEYALPLGNKEIKNPLDKSIWKKVQLGGQYYIEPDKIPVNILINLKGESNGYIIEKCWIARNEEFASFKEMLNKWQKILKDYYNVFVE